MMREEEEPYGAELEDFREVTLEELFEHPLRSDNSSFYKDNQIIRNPDKVLAFLK